MRPYRPMTLQRLEEILRRQDPPAFGSEYEPSFNALSPEAPPQSNNGYLWCERIPREIQYLSAPEQQVLSIVLYCPWLFDIQEQRMLPALPAPHPLEGHPRAAHLILPRLRGTLAITEDLGALHVHPTIRLTGTVYATSDLGTDEVPACWIGDELLFLEDTDGPFNVNISVKKKLSDFELPEIKQTLRSDGRRLAFNQRIRQKTEEILYAEVGIETICVASETLHATVVANLRRLANLQRRPSTLNAEQENLVVEAFRAAVESGDTPLSIAHYLVVHEQLDFEDIQAVFHKAVFRRKLRVDLHQPILFDHPLYPEATDVLDEYGHWFRRTAR